jgi:photosystem II stability/assembly factor-like uncharacterized protein
LYVKIPRYFSVLAAFGMLFALHAGAQGTPIHPQPAPAGASTVHQPTPEQIAKMPVRALLVNDFKLLSSTTGWASSGSQLLLTTDNGAHWKDISPPNPNYDGYASVFFHDADTGWVLFAHRSPDGEYPAPDSPDNEETFYVSATVNGGGSWKNANLPEPEHDPQGNPGLTGSGIISFADKNHGWLSLDFGIMHFRGSLTLTTSDGGRTWNWAGNGIDGIIDGILDVTDKDIWMIGRSDEDDSSQLGVSHDGGKSYQTVTLPTPKGFSSFGYPEYALPVFTDSLNGYVAVTYSDSEASKSVAVLFATQDGGRTWKQDRILTNLAEEETVKSTVAGSAWILPFAPQGSQPTLLKLRLNDTATVTTHKGSGDFNNCELSLLTQDVGWMNCSEKLSSTIDGGNTWTSIAPRARNGVLTTDPVTPVKSVPIQMRTIKQASASAN